MPTTRDEREGNAFERDKPGTAARTRVEGAIERLRKEGGIFVEAVRATRMPMAVTDPTLPGNPIVFANQSFLKLSGYQMEEVLGQQPYFLNGRDTDPRDAARFEEALRNDQDDIVETVQYRKDGTRFLASVLLSAFKGENGDTIHHFLSWLDVTRRHNAESRLNLLQQAQDALRESEERQAFLLRFTDAIRSETSGQAIVERAIQMLAEEMDLGRCYATRLYPTRDLTEVIHEVRRPGLAPMPSTLRNSDFPEAFRQTFERTLVFEDIANDPVLSDADKLALASMNFGALLSRPLRRDGSPIFAVGAASSGARHWTPAEVALIEDVAERTWAAVERARAEDALRASEQKYRTLFESIDEGFSEFDLIFDDSGRCVDFIYGEHNSALTRLTGLRDIAGRAVSEVVPNLEDVWFERYAHVARTGEPVRVQEYVHDLGRWFETYASRVGGPGSNKIVAVYNDITERKRAEEALRESESRLAAAFESVPAGVAVVAPDGKVVIDNAEFRRFLPGGIIPSRDFSSPSRWQGWDDKGNKLQPNDFPTARALRGERVTPGQEMLFTDDDGRSIWTLVATAPTYDAHGQVNGAVSTISDIDGRKRSEQALRENEQHARLLLAELQHRVRNTLAVVRSIAQRTADNSSSVNEMLAHFQGRLDAFSRVQAALTRTTDGKVDLQSLIDDELLAHAAREGRQIKITGPQVMLEARTAERMSLAIHELVTNAVKHGALSDPSGKIRIDWEVDGSAEEQRLLFNWRESGVELGLHGEQRKGFGTELLLRSLPYDLGATTEMELERGGMQFRLTLPLPQRH